MYLNAIFYYISGNNINFNIWKSYGSKFLSYYNDAKNFGAIISVLTHAMVNDVQYFFLSVNISGLNSCFYSILIFNFFIYTFDVLIFLSFK